jgi:hypothetical protein
LRLITLIARGPARNRARGHCYDCGRALTRATPLDGELAVCAYCAEIVAPAEQIGSIAARWGRAIYHWHSATQDPRAAGWRRRGGRWAL